MRATPEGQAILRAKNAAYRASPEGIAARQRERAKLRAATAARRAAKPPALKTLKPLAPAMPQKKNIITHEERRALARAKYATSPAAIAAAARRALRAAEKIAAEKQKAAAAAAPPLRKPGRIMGIWCGAFRAAPGAERERARLDARVRSEIDASFGAQASMRADRASWVDD